MEDKELLEMNLADTIIERPVAFSVDNQRFFIYPASLGKTYLLTRLLKSLNADEKILPHTHIWKHYACALSRKK